MNDLIPNNTIKSKDSSLGKFAMFALVILAILFLPFVAGFIKEKFFVDKSFGENTDYYAVFLENSQVYFGKIISRSNEEIVLKDVYYLQAGSEANTNLNNQQFTLVKLGQELHGPMDEMFINTKSILFYERLRPNSKVVESINKM